VVSPGWVIAFTNHVQHGPRETGKRLTYPRTEQCRDGAGEEAARAKYYDIRHLYRGNYPPRHLCAGRLDCDLRNLFVYLVHHRLASRNGTVGVANPEGETLRGCWVDVPLDSQEACRLLHTLAKTARHVRERRDDDVAYAVVREVAFTLEAVVEDLGQLSATGEGYQAVPYVARRGYPEFLS
jgi:hypothetical protein